MSPELGQLGLQAGGKSQERQKRKAARHRHSSDSLKVHGPARSLAVQATRDQPALISGIPVAAATSLKQVGGLRTDVAIALKFAPVTSYSMPDAEKTRR